MTGDIANVLQRLVLACEAVLTLRDPGGDVVIGALCDDVLKAYNKPAEHDRVVHRYTIQLAEAMACAAHARSTGRAGAEAVYFQIIGVVLPVVRIDFGTALEQRGRPTP